MLNYDIKKKRQQMVKTQLVDRGIDDGAVLNAFREVPRHKFVPEELQEKAYEDTPLLIEEGQTISQPYIVAEMIQALEPGKEDVVLEVGTGSGYAAAVLSRIVSRIYTIEFHETLAEKAENRYNELGYDNIEITIGDGSKGWPEKAPFSGILVSAAAPDIPDTLLEQLKIGGKLVLPVGDKYLQELLQITKVSEEELSKKALGKVRFVPLVGEEGWGINLLE